MKGVNASNGIAIGKALIKHEDIIIPENIIADSAIEIERFEKAVNESKEQLKDIYNKTLANIGEQEARIFDAHLLILEDPELIDSTKKTIVDRKYNGEWALDITIKSLVDMLLSLDNEYLRERAADIRDVGMRVIANLMGIKSFDFSSIDEPVVIIARDLTPSDTAQLPKDKVLGFITEIGGRTSHSAIMARTLEIPAIVGAGDILKDISDGSIVIMDGSNGDYYIDPSHELLQEYDKKKNEYSARKNRLKDLVGKPSISRDGRQVKLFGNIGSPNDVEGANRNDAEGIGLFRSEFLYMDRTSLPSEDEQFDAYKQAAEGMNHRSVIIRTLDIGGDKNLDYLDFPREENPFLGYRAIRYCLDKKDVFRTQLRALLRASVYGDIKIMFPMISSYEELIEAKSILSETMEELDRENIEYNSDIEVGMMIEVPAAAMISDILASEVSFFSIGTNDLIQYTTAVDRMNNKIANLYSPYHPALLRLVNMVIQNGHRAGIDVGMCGEVASNPKLIPVLLGMGLDEFSMSPSAILESRDIIGKCSMSEMKTHVEEIIKLKSSTEVEEYLDKYICG